MYEIQQITNDPLQKQNVILPDGTFFSMTLYFMPMQKGWFIRELVYSPSNLTIKGLRISNNVNMLFQWRNKIPFGLACVSVSEREPMILEDFQSGNSKLYLLNQEEVRQYVEYLSDQVSS